MKTLEDMKATCFNLIRQMQREDWLVTKTNAEQCFNDGMKIVQDKGFTKEQSEKIVLKAMDSISS